MSLEDEVFGRVLLVADTALGAGEINPLRSIVFAPNQNLVPPAPIAKPLLRSEVPVDTRLSSDLYDLVRNGGHGTSPFLRNGQGEIGVRILAQDAAGVLPALQSLGFVPTATIPQFNLLEGFVPAAALAKLDRQAPASVINIGAIASPQTAKGMVTSQADAMLESARVRATTPPEISGAGITIGILSDSFDRLGGAASGRANGDLPLVTVLAEGMPGGSDEGRAMAEVIHDLAPGAGLAFATASGGEMTFAQHILDLGHISHILVDDFYYPEEPMFQDGVIAQAINTVVTTKGVAYFSAAGNLATQAYESAVFTTASDFLPGVGNIDGYDFNLSDGVDTRQELFLAAGQSLELVLQWDDPFYTLNGVDTDLDFFLVRTDTGEIVASSVRKNLQSQAPVERIFYTNTSNSISTFDVVIQHVAGPLPGHIKYVNYGRDRFGSIGFNEYNTASGTIIPHAAAALASAVGAAPYFDQRFVQGFSSAGPVQIFFDPNGDQIDSLIRSKPDFIALDSVDNSFFGRDVDGNGVPNFVGTSAAAAHAAAIAALVKESNPSLTPTQIYNRLATTAVDIDLVGKDRFTGAGLINAYDAVFGNVIPSTLNFSDGLESGALGIAYQTQTNRAGQIQVTENNGVVSVLRHVILDSGLNGVNSRNELVLHIDAAHKSKVILSFWQREFGDEDHPMPETFVGSGNFDGVALSVDGINWYRLVDLTGDNSTEFYKYHEFDLSTIAQINGFELTANTQIKFQQFDNFGINFAQTPLSSDGFAFDFITVLADFTSGSSSNNILTGNVGPDVLLGLEGTDRLNGNDGNDILVGGPGRDLIFGGGGSDIFRYDQLTDSLASAPDRLATFSQPEGDRFRLLPNNPTALFNGGNLVAFGLNEAVVLAYGDADGVTAGAQPLGSHQAVLFGFDGRTFLSINDGTAGFEVNRDLVVEILTFGFKPGDVNLGFLTASDYFG
ncbi:MAG: S8 family serine peptidase [Oscillatoriales cyanobacterium SM2_2_1]|nr:S8 family serine peptidase [Oscillatoriales cyanobacterium SM2_2_1]